VCQKIKPVVGKVANPLHPLLIPGGLWEAVLWNLIGPLPKSRTDNAVVTIIDTHMKAIKLEPANITVLAMGAAVIMRDRVY
jgi:hypothetical protein